MQKFRRNLTFPLKFDHPGADTAVTGRRPGIRSTQAEQTRSHLIRPPASDGTAAGRITGRTICVEPGRTVCRTPARRPPLAPHPGQGAPAQ